MWQANSTSYNYLMDSFKSVIYCTDEWTGLEDHAARTAFL